MPFDVMAGHAVLTMLHTKSTMTAPKNAAVARRTYRKGRSDVAERRIRSATSDFNGRSETGECIVIVPSPVPFRHCLTKSEWCLVVRHFVSYTHLRAHETGRNLVC